MIVVCVSVCPDVFGTVFFFAVISNMINARIFILRLNTGHDDITILENCWEVMGEVAIISLARPPPYPIVVH